MSGPKRAGGGFDWPALMRVGLVDLGLAPERFWALTPAEFLLISGASAGAAPLGRAGLEALAAQFPDTPSHRSANIDVVGTQARARAKKGTKHGDQT